MWPKLWMNQKYRSHFYHQMTQETGDATETWSLYSGEDVESEAIQVHTGARVMNHQAEVESINMVASWSRV